MKTMKVLMAAVLVVALAGCDPHTSKSHTNKPQPYRSATDREKLEHKIKQGADCDQSHCAPSHQEPDGGWVLDW